MYFVTDLRGKDGPPVDMLAIRSALFSCRSTPDTTARGQHPNMLLLDLIDIHKYNKTTLLKNGNKKFYGSTLHRLVAGIEGASHEKPLCPRYI